METQEEIVFFGDPFKEGLHVLGLQVLGVFPRLTEVLPDRFDARDAIHPITIGLLAPTTLFGILTTAGDLAGGIADLLPADLRISLRDALNEGIVLVHEQFATPETDAFQDFRGDPDEVIVIDRTRQLNVTEMTRTLAVLLSTGIAHLTNFGGAQP
jgi:hypothetical protein